MPDGNRMKIAFVYDVIYPYVKGGVEKRVWELAVRLAKRGHEVHIFGMKYWDGDDILIRDSVILHGVCPARPLYAGGKRTLGEAINFSLRLIPHLGKYRFDIIDCQQFPFFSCLTAKSLAIIKRTPLVITWHEVWGNYWYTYLGRGAGMFGKWVERLVARLTPHILAVSATTSENLRKTGCTQTVTIIPNGIDLMEIAATQPSDVPTDIIFAGRLIQEKHVDLLVEAIGLLVPHYPQLNAIIIGDGPERDQIRLLIRARGLEDHITLRGFFEDHRKLIALFKSSKVFVLPSTREGFGITALEAQACGLPIVTIHHPANAVREIVEGKTGFLCALSAQDLAGNIRSALEKYGTMREACTAASQRYDWNLIADHAEEYYRAVVGTRA